jgi:hypothetical protein
MIFRQNQGFQWSNLFFIIFPKVDKKSLFVIPFSRQNARLEWIYFLKPLQDVSFQGINPWDTDFTINNFNTIYYIYWFLVQKLVSLK